MIKQHLHMLTRNNTAPTTGTKRQKTQREQHSASFTIASFQFYMHAVY